MARADTKLKLRCVVLAASLSVMGLAVAQGQPAAGFSKLDGGRTDARLYPKAPNEGAGARQRKGEAKAEPKRGDQVQQDVNLIVVEVDRNSVPADGQSQVQVQVRLFAPDGQQLSQSKFVTLEHSAGRVLLPGAPTDEAGPRGMDSDRVAPGIQLKVEQGVAKFMLLAPAQAQDVNLRVSVDGQEAAGVISFVPDLRPMIASGLVEGVISLTNKGGITPARSGDGFEQEIQSWSREFNGGKANAAARAAFFLKGTIRGDMLLTASYDSDKVTRARVLKDIKPDELYPVYGDSSLRTFDARSGDKLYVRIDKDKSYLLYGDFVTGDGFSQQQGQGAVASLKQRSLGQYNRTATGVRAHHEVGGMSANAFVSNDTLRAAVEEFSSQGSGPYALRNSAVLEGSDKVEIITRDRNQPSRIIAVRPLVRLVDYTFEPFSGRILLASFLPSVDESLNPTSLRVTYEVDQGGEAFWVAGADAQWRVNDQVEVGGSAVVDSNDLAPYKLISANATIKLSPTTAIVVEGAQSTSTVNTNPANQAVSPGLAGRSGEIEGRAARVELVHEGERTEGRVYAGRSSSTFNNPSAPLEGGRNELYAKGAVKVTDDVKVFAEVAKSESRNTGGGKRQDAALGVQWLVNDRLQLEASIHQAQERIGAAGNGMLTTLFGMTSGLTSSIATGSAGGALGIGSRSVDPASGLPIVVQGSLPTGTSSLPAGTELESKTVRLGIGYRLSDKLRLGGEVETDVAGDSRRRIALGADYQVAERTRLYGRYEVQDGWVQMAGVSDTARSASTFALGVESTYVQNTELFSEYRLRDAISGRDLQMASGLRHYWDLAEGVRANAAVEQVKVLSGLTATTRAFSAGLDYAASPLWRGSARLEFRRSGDIDRTADNEAFDTTLFQVMAARKLDRDWTLLARNYTLLTDYVARGNVLQNRAQLGVAYRETDTNRFNALAKVEYKLERDDSNTSVGELQSRAWIVSAHGDWHPSRPWWMTGRVAAKWQSDRFEGGVQDKFNAQLLSGRVVYDITERWDLGAMGAVQLGQHSARQTALGVEVGYLLQQNLWLSAGFNFAGFAGDADLSGYEYTRAGAYLRLRFKFDENLLRGAERMINRSLDR